MQIRIRSIGCIRHEAAILLPEFTIISQCSVESILPRYFERDSVLLKNKKLGIDAQCYRLVPIVNSLTNEVVVDIIIDLGSQPTLQPGDVLHVDGIATEMIWTSFFGDLLHVNTSLVVSDTSTQAIYPVPRIVRLPRLKGDDAHWLYLDAATSTGTGGREAIYEWLLVNETTTGTSSSVLLKSSSEEFLEFNALEFPNVPIRLMLHIENAFGRRSSEAATYDFIWRPSYTETVSNLVEMAASITVLRSERLVIAASLLRASRCDKIVSWTALSGPSQEFQNVQRELKDIDTLTLNLPAATLHRVQYVLQLTVRDDCTKTITDTGEKIEASPDVSKTVHISVVLPEFQVVLKALKTPEFLRIRTFVSDLEDSSDSIRSYEWFCNSARVNKDDGFPGLYRRRQLDLKPCATTSLEFVSSSSSNALHVPSDALLEGFVYNFTVDVAVSSGILNQRQQTGSIEVFGECYNRFREAVIL